MELACPGFRFGAVAAGIKKTGALDLALMACDRPAAAAAVFTRNRVKAAPVLVSRAQLGRNRGKARAVIVNSGNANACTGKAGMADARRMIALAAAAIEAPRDQVLVASTGVIGAPLPMDRIEAGVDGLAGRLRADGFDDFAHAILTTDRAPKMARRELRIGGAPITLLGCTKGAGMIAPDMATTLTFVACDARVAARPLQQMLARATARTYNAILVDGDTSTNDMILVMASGATGGPARGGDARAVEDALTGLLDELARALMRDGEGVHHVVTVTVRGARSERAAARVARSIARSPLVKTAIAGADPNWGRVLAAAGNAGVPVKPDRLALWIDRIPIAAAGCAVPDPAAEPAARAVMQRREYSMTVDLGDGGAEAHYLACDLSHDYVDINASYRT
jgi:glutamate N-acetyltransferase / amino-acid N-acetyltransferase